MPAVPGSSGAGQGRKRQRSPIPTGSPPPQALQPHARWGVPYRVVGVACQAAALPAVLLEEAHFRVVGMAQAAALPGVQAQAGAVGEWVTDASQQG